MTEYVRIKNDNRIVWVDNLKGLLLLLTCTSHFMPKPWIIASIVKPTPTYYVPLFIFLSGYLCKPLSTGLSIWEGQVKLLKRRNRKLLIPYFFFSLFGLICGYVTGERIESMVWDVLYSGSSCHAARPIWFAACLFMVSMSFSWIIWSEKLSKLPILISIVVCLLIIWVFTKDFHIKLPWYLKSLPWLGSFFLLGYIVRQLEYTYLKSDFFKHFVFFPIILTLAFGVWGLMNPIKGTLLAIVCPVSMMIGIIGCINYFPFVGALVSKPIPFLQFIALNGIAILGSHNLLIGFLHFFLDHYGIILNTWMSFISIFILVWVLLFFVVVPFMNRYMYKVLGNDKPS